MKEFAKSLAHLSESIDRNLSHLKLLSREYHVKSLDSKLCHVLKSTIRTSILKLKVLYNSLLTKKKTRRRKSVKFSHRVVAKTSSNSATSQEENYIFKLDAIKEDLTIDIEDIFNKCARPAAPTQQLPEKKSQSLSLIQSQIKDTRNTLSALKLKIKLASENFGLFISDAQSNLAKICSVQNISDPRSSLTQEKSGIESTEMRLIAQNELLNDVLHQVYNDSINRNIRISPIVAQAANHDITQFIVDVKSLHEKILNVKPAWKNCWEKELQQIIQEQELLNRVEKWTENLINFDCSLMQDKLQVIGHKESRVSTLFFDTSSIESDISSSRETLVDEVKITLEMEGENASEKRLSAMERAERVQKWKRSLGRKESDFEAELKASVLKIK